MDSMRERSSIPELAWRAAHRRIVVTGGPGGGKTTAADMFRREMGARLAVVPEAATILFAGGFPRSNDPSVAEVTQAAIYQVQRHLEEAQAALFPGRILLCDRGTVDGAAYWPTTPAAFFASVGSTLDAELARYDAVLFFESAAVGGLPVDGGNPVRIESNAAAAALDARLREDLVPPPALRLRPSRDLVLLEDLDRPRGAHAALRGARTMTMRIAQFMSHPVHTIGCSFSLAEAREQMTAAHVRHLVVVDRGRCVGILSDRDIYRWESKKPIEPEVLPVGEAMTADVYTVSPEKPLGEVAAEMARLGVGSALVMAGDEPVGIFTSNDALHLLSRWAGARLA